MSRMLDVYLQDQPVGCLEQNESGDLQFTYSAEYCRSAMTGISLSLPLQRDPFVGRSVKAFFSGLLPEESVRERLAAYVGVSAKNPFALLEIVGGDCAGALALYPQGQTPQGLSAEEEVLDEARLKAVLDLIKRRPMLAGDEGYRLSLAGAQDKLAVGYRDGNVLLIKGGAPTTHILKPLIDRIKDSAHNEFFCMKLAQKVGIEVPEASLYFVEGTPYYLVERYDRFVEADGVVKRVHQEDFCQALGTVPEIKYEREGGPSLADCQDLIARYAARPAFDQMKLIRLVLFNFLIGNSDAHGKNFSLLYRGAKPELAPAYDLLSTAVYPDLSKNMAMKIGGKYKPKEVCRRHFYRLVPETKTAQSAMDRQITVMKEKTIRSALALKAELVSFGLVSDVFDEILSVIERRSKRLKE